jgi:hypothetical protein
MVGNAVSRCAEIRARTFPPAVTLHSSLRKAWLPCFARSAGEQLGWVLRAVNVRRGGAGRRWLPSRLQLGGAFRAFR